MRIGKTSDFLQPLTLGEHVDGLKASVAAPTIAATPVRPAPTGRALTMQILRDGPARMGPVAIPKPLAAAYGSSPQAGAPLMFRYADEIGLAVGYTKLALKESSPHAALAVGAAHWLYKAMQLRHEQAVVGHDPKADGWKTLELFVGAVPLAVTAFPALGVPSEATSLVSELASAGATIAAGKTYAFDAAAWAAPDTAVLTKTVKYLGDRVDESIAASSGSVVTGLLAPGVAKR